jgi:hypothetical protein
MSFQPFPKTGPLFANLDKNKRQLKALIRDQRDGVHAYVMTSGQYDAKRHAELSSS